MVSRLNNHLLLKISPNLLEPNKEKSKNAFCKSSRLRNLLATPSLICDFFQLSFESEVTTHNVLTYATHSCMIILVYAKASCIYWKCNFSMNPHVCPLVGRMADRSFCHKLRAGSYTSVLLSEHLFSPYC